MLWSLLVAFSCNQSAPALNARGFELYQQKDYAAALVKFREATKANPKHALSHYNLACTLALLRTAGKVFEFDASKSTITELLLKSIALDERRRARARSDADLESIRDTFAYQIILKRSPQRAIDVKPILVAVGWHGPPQGAYGPNPNLDFFEDGTVILNELVLADDKVTSQKSQGTFSVQRGSITVTLKGVIYSATLSLKGELRITGLGVFSDNAAECDA
jgi:tetratricopeptide (TPR) repeat protein